MGLDRLKSILFAYRELVYDYVQDKLDQLEMGVVDHTRKDVFPYNKSLQTAGAVLHSHILLRDGSSFAKALEVKAVN